MAFSTQCSQIRETICFLVVFYTEFLEWGSMMYMNISNFSMVSDCTAQPTCVFISNKGLISLESPIWSIAEIFVIIFVISLHAFMGTKYIMPIPISTWKCWNMFIAASAGPRYSVNPLFVVFVWVELVAAFIGARYLLGTGIYQELPSAYRTCFINQLVRSLIPAISGTENLIRIKWRHKKLAIAYWASLRIPIPLSDAVAFSRAGYGVLALACIEFLVTNRTRFIWDNKNSLSVAGSCLDSPSKGNREATLYRTLGLSRLGYYTI